MQGLDGQKYMRHKLANADAHFVAHFNRSGEEKALRSVADDITASSPPDLRLRANLLLFSANRGGRRHSPPIGRISHQLG